MGGELKMIELALQRLQFRVIAFNDYPRATSTVMVPATTITYLQALVPSLNAVPGVCLAIVGLPGLVDLNTD